MRERHALFLLLLLALLVRLAGLDHGLVIFSAEDPPPGVKGTVYTFYPDEREFMACFRSLGNSLAEYRGSSGEAGGFRLDIPTLLDTGKGVLSGRITFAPAWPLASLPVAPYLVFFTTIPLVAIKYLMGFYPAGLDSNAVFAESIRAGRILSAVAGAWLVLVIGALARLLCRSRIAVWTAMVIAALHPLGIMLGHYASYNVLVALLELAALLWMVRWHAVDDRRGLLLAGMLAGLALATKTTAGALLPLLVVTAASRTDRPLRERARSAAGALLAAAGAWILALSYSLLTRSGDIARTIRTQLLNVSGDISGLPIPKALVVANYYDTVLPFALSTGVALLAYASVPVLAARSLKWRYEPRSRGWLVVLVYLAAWLGLSSANGLNQASRMLVPSLLLVLALAAGLDALRGSGRAAALAAVLALVPAGAWLGAEAALTTRWFLQEDIRLRADRWIQARLPASTRIGYFYEMVYNYQPTLLYTDAFWRRHPIYNYTPELELAGDSFPVDVIVTNRMELLFDNWKLAPQADAILAHHGFERVATFSPELSWGPFRVVPESTRFFLPNLFVSEIYIYERTRADRDRLPAGQGASQAAPGADDAMRLDRVDSPS